MSNLRSDIVSLGAKLSRENDKAFDLWTWLPSYKAAQAAHGDYATEHMPQIEDVLAEATMFICHGLHPTDEQKRDAGELYQCPCGEFHMPNSPFNPNTTT